MSEVNKMEIIIIDEAEVFSWEALEKVDKIRRREK